MRKQYSVMLHVFRIEHLFSRGVYVDYDSKVDSNIFYTSDCDNQLRRIKIAIAKEIK